VVQLNRLLSRCARWRAYAQAEFPIADQQAAEGFILAASLAEALEEEGAEIVDPSIPEALRYLSKPSGDLAALSDVDRSLARDCLVSLSNCLKRLFEKVGNAALHVDASFAKGVRDGAAAEAEEEGQRLGRQVWRILSSFADIAKRLLAAGIDEMHNLCAYLAEQHPQILGCLEYFKAIF
jgi:Asp-tRNA(Asn)/Glu-tRNA(Gln) amidotransferase A subunit family amidase